jgi:formate dehydrogenase subunit beta
MVNLDDLKKEAKRVLADGKVKYVIGFAKSTGIPVAAPVFIKNPDDVDQLVWDSTCVQNLTKFLVDEKKRKAREKKPDTRPVGIVVKGCDSRAINVLLQEKYIEREDVFIIGVSCEDLGVLDVKKISQSLNGSKIEKIEVDDKMNVTAFMSDGNHTFKAQEIMAARCRECKANFPVIYDVFLGEKTKRTLDDPYKSIEKITELSQQERWAFWKDQLNKCIRCYACRSVCPMCYCDECVVDTINFAITAETTADEKAQKIKWVEKSPATSENYGYHFVRAIHLAGRCIDCGECERVCPLEIPIRYLNKKLEKAAKELFDYDVGFDPEQPSLVSSFKDEDPEDFIR